MEATPIVDKPAEDLDYLMEPPVDLHEIYMKQLLSLSKSKGFFTYYMTLLSLVNIGSQLIPDQYGKLKEDVQILLEDPVYYPQRRQVEQDGNNYRLGGENTGLIVVRHADMYRGLNEALEQQTAWIVPKLKVLDNKLFNILVQEGIIERKRPILEDLLVDQTVSELADLLAKRQKVTKEAKK